MAPKSDHLFFQIAGKTIPLSGFTMYPGTFTFRTIGRQEFFSVLLLFAGCSVRPEAITCFDPRSFRSTNNPGEQSRKIMQILNFNSIMMESFEIQGLRRSTIAFDALSARKNGGKHNFICIAISGVFTFSTPLFFTPTILLGFVATVGFFRYLHTKNTAWQDVFSPAISPDRRLSPLSKLILALSSFVTVTYLVDTLVVVARVFANEGAMPATFIYYIVTSWIAWVVAIICLLDESHKFSSWHWLQYTFFAMAAAGESLVAWLWVVSIYKPRPGSIFTIYDNILLGVFLTRYILELSTFGLSIVHMVSAKRTGNSESAPLLNSSANYGSIPANEEISTSNKDENRSGYHDFWNKLAKVMPYIWPHHDRYLQSLVLACFLLMCLGLTINVFTPLQIGRVVDKFNQEPETFAWAAVLAYVGFKFLQGGSGLIQAVQNWLWIPIGQYTTREVSVKLFAHLHSLSLHYHINRKTGEVLRTVDRGTNSIVQLLSQIVFQIFPALANILIAVIVFSVRFSLPFGLIVFVTMSLYLYTTVTLTEWRNSFRRKMNELDNFARTKAVDSLLNFETVKYYNAEGFEVDRYDKAIVEYQKADYVNSVSLNVLNLAQNAVITGGLLAGSLLFAFEVSKGNLTPGDFVTFNVYMMQLYTPLHFFGTYYRMIQQNFIDMEKMFDLFEVEESVKDVEGASDLFVSDGHVQFDNVTFSYDNRQTALNGISFTIPKGASVALVGPSGGGKSTILRLLFRFYDPDSGCISIDGQDISQVKQSSLRKNIGVVPQDTVLFNDTILYNIRYGDINASDEDVYRAAKAAQIHDKIMSFPDGYETKVGERGLRLSGGEKQRVAIARTILKNPPIILLDEATSALDTTTERHIQVALADMTKGRTTLAIAHRLSTIVNSDLILVVKDGKVVESGSHDDLIQRALSNENEGIYYEMWHKQLDDHHESSQNGEITPLPLHDIISAQETAATIQPDHVEEAPKETKSRQVKGLEISIPRNDKHDLATAISSGTDESSKVLEGKDMVMTPVDNVSPVDNTLLVDNEDDASPSTPTHPSSQSGSKRNRSKKKKRSSRK
ncbi:hypothetical protein INT47_004514 [Mucor saturninus]|uniref:ATP-binding cassette sub-family B member 6 n=1 Tax=Mucor saturninus TaxID=64648 RepID=A0A8H7RLG2_9FUNG|nr:hypothetical protein INT47_004514 [Mucor saturninus]